MEQYKKEINKVKRGRKICIALFFVSIFFVLLFGNRASVTVNGSVHIFWEGWPQPLVLVAILLILFIFMVWYGLIACKIDNILNYNCLPEKYSIIKLNTDSKRIEAEEKLLTNMRAAYFKGDFTACKHLAGQFPYTRKFKYIYSAYSFSGKSSYFLGELDELKLCSENLKAVVDSVKKEKARIVYMQQYTIQCLLISLLEGDKEKALEAAESLKQYGRTNLEKTQICFFKALAYFENGKKNEAIHNFMTVREVGGETFYVNLANEYIKKIG